MEIFNITQNGLQTINITQLCIRTIWSGDTLQVARKLELQVVCPAFDAYIPQIEIDVGSMMLMLADDGKEIFRGYVFSKEKDFNGEFIRLVCYDGLIYLTKSKASYNFNKLPPEEIANKICDDFVIPKGNFASTKIGLTHIVINKTPYEILMEVYSIIGKLIGEKYIALMQEGKLNIIEIGRTVTAYILDPEVNITNTQYSESIENMVNRVKIYDDKGNYKGEEAKNDDWVKAFGILQDTYTKEKDKDATTIAQNKLKGLERKGRIEALGNVGCITGNAILIREPYTYMEGLFYIESDTHIWEGGHHTMQLIVNFKKMLDGKEKTIKDGNK